MTDPAATTAEPVKTDKGFACTPAKEVSEQGMTAGLKELAALRNMADFVDDAEVLAQRGIFPQVEQWSTDDGGGNSYKKNHDSSYILEIRRGSA